VSLGPETYLFAALSLALAGAAGGGRGDGPPKNRFYRPITASRLAAALGAICLMTSTVLLSRPAALAVFAPTETLQPAIEAAVGWTQLAIGLLGLSLLAAAMTARVQAMRLSVRVGDVVIVGLGAIVFLGLAEGWLRIRAFQEWGSALKVPPTLDEARGNGGSPLRPGRFAQRAVSEFDSTYDHVVSVTVNRFGLRGREPAMPKPPGLFRIVALGGSTTFGYSVADEDAWPSQLATRLGPRCEVLNGGRPGATTYRNFAYLRDHLMRLDPDVVVFYEGFNDMWRAVRRHAGDQPDYGIVDEGLPPTPGVLDQGAPVPWSWPVSLLGHRGARWIGHRFGARSPSWPEPPVGKGPFRFDSAIVAIYEKNLGAMVRLCRSRGVQPVLATFAACDDPALPEAEENRRMRYVTREIPQLDAKTGQQAMDLYRKMTRCVAEAEGVPLIDAAREMPKDLRDFTDTIHFTPDGEKALAGVIAKGLRKSHVLPAGG
jgi:lysophospholipase L1-like esterase